MSNCTPDSITWEAVPRYFRQPRVVLRAQLRSAALAILAAGQGVSVLRLRQHGVRGGTATIIALREEMVAAGELPPEAAARVYAPPLHAPGKASTTSCPPTTGPGPQQGRAGVNRQLTTAERSEARARRRSERLIRRYDSAVRCIFGRARARQIGGAP